mgnify:CR=1 FL=1
MEGQEVDDKNKYNDINKEQIEMIKDVKRNGISALGTFLSVIFLLFVVACIFLIGFQLRVYDSRWGSKSPIKGLCVMQIVHVSVAFITALLANSLFFCCAHKPGFAKAVRFIII